jgi:sigma-B regulation protein RsbU (phosphoserine phosphatase)
MPASEVGGDFYTYHRFDNHNFALTIGDVSGKGMPAALLMAASLAHFDSALAYKLTPAHLLNHLDQALLRYTQPTRQNCALCYVELSQEATPTQGNHSPWKLCSVNAGGIPPFIKRHNGSVEWPEIGGFALGQGLGSELGYKQLEMILNTGDMIILTSDGVAEATNQQAEFLGFERLETIIRQGPLTSAQAMLTHILTHINQFVGLAAPHDDLTIVVVQV